MFKKILAGVTVFSFLLIAALISIPFLFKDKINEKIKVEINKNLLADVDYGKFDLTIIRSFPNLTFSLYDLSIVGRDMFEGDTLAKFNEFSFGMNLMSVFRSDQIEIHSVFIDKLSIIALEYLDEETGELIANYNILPPSDQKDETESSEFKVNLKSFVLKDAYVYYNNLSDDSELMLFNIQIDAAAKYSSDKTTFDALLKIDSVQLTDKTSSATVGEFAFNGKGYYTETRAEISSNTVIDALSYRDNSTWLLRNALVNFKLDADADLTNNIYTLKENELSVNNLKTYFDGKVGLMENDDIDIDLTFKADKTSFKELLSLIPAEYLKEYDGLKADGNFTLKGFAKGIYNENSIPAFGLDLAIENGRIQYPDLPTPIEKINLTANISSPDREMKQLSVSVPKATFSVQNESVELSLFVQEAMVDPLIDFAGKGSLDLSKVPQFYPLEGVNKISGVLVADLAFKGRQSDVENENYKAIDFRGNMQINDLVYDAVDYPKPLFINNLNLEFTPQFAHLKSLDAKFGKSDFNVNGRLENFLNYALNGGILSGTLNLNSNNIDLDELMAEDSSASAESSEETGIVKVPADIDFTAKMNAQKINYDGLELKNVSGTLIVRDEKVTLENVRANLLGGSALISGSYSTKDTDLPVFDFSYKITKLSIQETFNYVNTVQKIAPIAKYLNGTFSSEMAISSLLNPDLSVNLSALTGDGEVRIPHATITSLPIFDRVAQTLKIPAFDKPELNDAWTVLQFKDGRVNVDPFDIKLKDIKMNIEGSNGFDETINYLMRITVPSDKFGNAAALANDFLKKQNIPLFNLSAPQNITFHLNVDGLLSNPNVKIVKVTADQGDRSIRDQVKDTVKEELDRAKQQAQQELDKQKERAQQELDAQKQKAEEELRKQKEEAERRAQEEAERLKQEAKDKAKQKLRGFGF
jgi:hypothetical protein